MDRYSHLGFPPIVERIVRIRCWNCNKVIGSTENNIIGEDALLEAARKTRICPMCGAHITGKPI